jgi:hypothetical protein
MVISPPNLVWRVRELATILLNERMAGKFRFQRGPKGSDLAMIEMLLVRSAGNFMRRVADGALGELGKGKGGQSGRPLPRFTNALLYSD